MINFCKYVEAAAALAKQKAGDDVISTGSPSEPHSSSSALAGFCELHHQMLTLDKKHAEHSYKVLHRSWFWGGAVRDFNEDILVFRDSVGIAIYDEHAFAGMNKLLVQVEDGFLDISSVPASMFETEMPFAARLKRMLKPKAWLHVERQVQQEPDIFEDSIGKESFVATMKKFSRQLSFNAFVELVEAIGRPGIKLQGAVHVDNAECGFEWRDALNVIKLELSLRDIAVLAMIVSQLIGKDHKVLSISALVGHMTSKQAMLAYAVTALESKLRQMQGEELEQNWQLPNSVLACEGWYKSAATLCGISLSLLLKLWAAKLIDMTEKVKGALPSWSAVLEHGCDLQKARKLYTKGDTHVVNLHNQLYDMMSQFAGAANRLGLTPPLATHELTTDAIKVADYTLKEASLAKLVYDAVVLLEDYQHAEDGPNKAEELKKGSGVAWGRLPAELRSRVESLAKDAKGTSSSSDMPPPPAPQGQGQQGEGLPLPKAQRAQCKRPTESAERAEHPSKLRKATSRLF